MLKGVNDSPAEARELVRLLKGIPAKINLIPFNPWPGTPYECSDWEKIEAFSDIVFNAGYASPVRTPRGRDILAACGQLKSETEKLRARAIGGGSGIVQAVLRSPKMASSASAAEITGIPARERHAENAQRDLIATHDLDVCS